VPRSPIGVEGGAAKLVEHLVSDRPGVAGFEPVGDEAAEVTC